MRDSGFEICLFWTTNVCLQISVYIVRKIVLLSLSQRYQIKLFKARF